MDTSSWWKADLHLHSREDLSDYLDYSAEELLLRAHALGFRALAITLHDTVFDPPELQALALALGILFISSAEMRLEGEDVVVLNIRPQEAAALRTWQDLRALRAARGESILILAPHPYYRLGGSMGHRRLMKEMDLFDAIELSHFHTKIFDRNRPARRAAQQYGKPMLATSDAHRLDLFGNHYALIEPPDMPTAEALFSKIRENRVQNVSPAYSLFAFVRQLCWIAFHDLRRIFPCLRP